MTANKDREGKDAITHEIKISFYQGRDIMWPLCSISPGNLITKHEDATREGKKKESKMNWPCSVPSTNLWNPACSLLAMQLHTTCWVLSRECGQQVTGELMKCQDGGREIACITYPQGALGGIFKNKSHNRRIQQAWSHFQRESCANFNS